MRKIPPTIWLILISLFLSGCIGGSSSGSAGFSSAGADNSFSGGSLISYYDSSSSSGSGGSSGDSGLGGSGGTAGHHNPEPASIALLGVGLAAILGKKLRRKK